VDEKVQGADRTVTADPYFRIFESIPLGIIVTDPGGRIQLMNPCARTILHIDDTAISDKVVHALPNLQPLGELLRDMHSGETGVKKINLDGRVVEILAALITDGEEERPKTVFTLRDITEIEKTLAAEKNHEKHALLSELSADIAHEIRNPLGSIELLASLFKKEAHREKDIHRANRIMAAVKTMENAISNLIHRNQQERIPFTHVNLHDLLREITLFSEKTIDGGGVFLTVSYTDVEPVVECNADMIKQVFLYLMINALTGSGRLDIATRYIEEERNIEIHFSETNRPGSNNSHTSIFNHPSNTKDDPWGLGMAIVHNIVNMHHGWLRVEYRKSVGTELVLSFPVVSVNVSQSAGIVHLCTCEKDLNEKK
jgi:nitrogen-specific signal transduction histidine kinase